MPCDVHAMAASMQKHSQIPWGWLPACKCQCGSVHDGDHNSVARNLEGLALKQWHGDKSICNSTTKVEVCTLLESVHNVTMTVWSEFFIGLSCVLWSLINYTTQNPTRSLFTTYENVLVSVDNLNYRGCVTYPSYSGGESWSTELASNLGIWCNTLTNLYELSLLV